MVFTRYRYYNPKTMNRIISYSIIGILILSIAVGCSKRQILPGIVAGAGGALTISGVAYRISLPEEDSDGLLGKQASQKAATGTLLLAGLALATIGIVWSATTPICEADYDCYGSERCVKETCVPDPKRPQEKADSSTSFRPVDPSLGKYDLNIPHLEKK